LQNYIYLYIKTRFRVFNAVLQKKFCKY